ncbi:MAG: DMT family transporter [Pseudomonadota bacterium]
MSQTTAAIGQESAPYKGIAYLVFGLSIFTLQDVIVRLLSDGYPVHQIVLLRSLFTLGPALLIVWLEGGFRLLKTRRPVMQALRGSLMFISFGSYYLALTAMPLADAVTLFYSCPLFVTLLAVPLLKEKVGARRLMAVLVGFSGIVVVAQPSPEGFEPAMLLALLAALSYGLSSIMTRKLSSTEAGSTLAFYTTVTYLFASALFALVLGDGRYATGGHPSSEFLLRAWAVPSLHDFGLMALCGLIAAVGFYCLSQAYRIASVSAVAPFEYCSMPWAVLWGYLFWAEVPSSTTLTGLSLVAGAGLYIIHREGVRGRRVARGRLRHKI